MHCFIKHCVLYPINKSNYKLYLYCQSIPIQAVLKYFIWEICFALYMICIIVLMTEALILHTVLKDFIWDRHVALYVLYADFFINFLLRYQRILSRRRKFSVFGFPPCLMCLKLWIHEPFFIYFVHNSFSKMLVWFLLICLYWPRNWKGRKRRHPEVHCILFGNSCLFHPFTFVAIKFLNS